MQREEKRTWIAVVSVLSGICMFLFCIPLLFAADDEAKTEQDYIQEFVDAFSYVRSHYVDEVEPAILFEGAIQGMLNILDDPYTHYLTASDIEDLMDTTTRGEYGGVGMIISRPAKDDSSNEDRSTFIEVVSPMEDTPAYKAGIHAGDLIIAVEDVSTKDLSLTEVANRLKGTPGTSVSITIRRGKNLEFPVTLTRQVIELATVKYDMIGNNIGYIRIIRFSPFTVERLQEAITELKKEEYSALVLDVRNNPGGLLTSAIDTTDLLLKDGIIVSTKSRIPMESRVYRATRSLAVDVDTPLLVLTDKGTASASEIFSGALRDHNRALLLGETTFGKGLVQMVQLFGEVGGGYKLTISRYYTPDGISIDKTGIEPDVKISEPEFSDEESDDFVELQENQTIQKFIENNPKPTEKEISSFVDTLQSKGNSLSKRLLRRLVREEIYRTEDFPPVYDLDYDLVLQKAVEIIQNGEYEQYMRE